jgi:hypothetical protein
MVGMEWARTRARACLDAADHTGPEEIARDRGIELREGQLDGARAQLVVGPRGSYILLSDRLTHSADRRWAIAHELGHYELQHPTSPAAEITAPRPRQLPRRRGHRNFENEADEFAKTLLMPTEVVERFCDRAPMTLDIVDELARLCDVPLSASAIRITESTFRICAAALSTHGTIRWMSPSLRFLILTGQQTLNASRTVGHGALARRYFDTETLGDEPALVPVAAWIDGLTAGSAKILEHSIELEEPGTVLSILWASNEPEVPRHPELTSREIICARDFYASFPGERDALIKRAGLDGSRPGGSASTLVEFFVRTMSRLRSSPNHV